MALKKRNSLVVDGCYRVNVTASTKCTQNLKLVLFVEISEFLVELNPLIFVKFTIIIFLTIKTILL